MWSPDLTTTGAAQTGFTSPTYSLAVDLAPDASSRQYVVTTAGGTQTGVRVSSAGDPFTHTVKKFPYRALPVPNPVTGSYGNIPKNRIDVLTRKGVIVDSNGKIDTMILRITAEIPAGAEVKDPANIRAAVSATLGLMAEEAADYGDSLIAGIW